MAKPKFPVIVLLYLLAGTLVWVLPSRFGRTDYLNGFFSNSTQFLFQLTMIVIHAALVGALQYCFELLGKSWDDSLSSMGLAVIGIFIILVLPFIGAGFIYTISMGYGSLWEQPILSSLALVIAALLLGYITRRSSENG